MIRNRTGAALVGLLLAVVVTAAGAAPAQAHDVLRSTDPANGATLPTAPDHVTLTFDQPALALGTQVVVLTPDGRDAATGDPVLVDATVTQELGGPLPAGEYVVQWRVTSSDGHPIDGTFTFVAAESGGEAPPSTTPSATPSTPEPTTPAASTSAPDSAQPAPSPTATSLDDGPSGGGPAAWIVGSVVVVLLGGLVVALVSGLRRRR